MVMRCVLFQCIAAIGLALGSCQSKQPVENGFVAKLSNRTITQAELTEAMPKHLSEADSMIWTESYIKQQLKDELIYEVAQRNLDDRNRNEIDRLVDAYRRSLIRYKYQEQLTKERLSSSITDEEKQRYYEENKQEMLLDHCLIKGLFLKIPVDAPNINEVKKWYRSTSEASIEKIEKYSVQNASIYEYFYDKWIRFDDVMDNIPMRMPKETDFLRSHPFVEIADSSFCYLLNIKEYILKGDVAPFDYANGQITEILENQRKSKFLKDFEDDLYNDAVRSGEIAFRKENASGTK